MRVKLEPKWVNILLHAPESQMAYHRVDVKMADGQEVSNAFAYNCEWLDLPDELETTQIAQIKLSEQPSHFAE